jgi:hypothetical protein
VGGKWLDRLMDGYENPQGNGPKEVETTAGEKTEPSSSVLYRTRLFGHNFVQAAIA